MMRILIGILLLLIVLLIAMPGPDSIGQSGIIVNNANTIRTVVPGTPSTNLATQARIAVQYGNSLRPLAVATLPAALQTRLTNAGDFVSAQYANTIRHIAVGPLPAALQAALSAIAARVAVQYANSDRAMALNYPSTLIHDTAAPMISNIASNSSGANGNITWTTNEFTRYQLGYGAQSGHYTEAIEEPLYAKQHSVTLPNLVAGQRYYFQITAIDRSDNQTVSAEHSLVAGPTPVPTPLPTATPAAVFLPLIEKR